MRENKEYRNYNKADLREEKSGSVPRPPVVEDRTIDLESINGGLSSAHDKVDGDNQIVM